jgi:hypothetical protein
MNRGYCFTSGLFLVDPDHSLQMSGRSSYCYSVAKDGFRVRRDTGSAATFPLQTKNDSLEYTDTYVILNGNVTPIGRTYFDFDNAVLMGFIFQRFIEFILSI